MWAKGGKEQERHFLWNTGPGVAPGKHLYSAISTPFLSLSVSFNRLEAFGPQVPGHRRPHWGGRAGSTGSPVTTAPPPDKPSRSAVPAGPWRSMRGWGVGGAGQSGPNPMDVDHVWERKIGAFRPLRSRMGHFLSEVGQVGQKGAHLAIFNFSQLAGDFWPFAASMHHVGAFTNLPTFILVSFILVLATLDYL